MSDLRDEKMKDFIRATAADFIQRESNGTSLITVTNVSISDRGSEATIFFTVLPADKEKAAYDFLKRMRSEFREYLMHKSRMRRIPFFDFEVDGGEKNRQKIDEISHTV